MKLKMKSIISKINFLLGRSPRIIKRNDWRRFIPEPFKAVVTITADFELAWAWRYSKSTTEPYKLAIDKARTERENIPKILELCGKYDIPITWATVGHLFLEECNRNEKGISHKEIPRLGNFENEFWKFTGNDWFEYDPCSNYKNAPEWYCPDLIEQILSSKVNHEIGCHTFSHIDCSDKVCPTEVFEAEINYCKEEAVKYGINLKSFVHPGHTIGNLRNLANAGFTSFQTDPGNILGYPKVHMQSLWELKRTYEFTFRTDWSVEYHIKRYLKIIDRAIENNTLCNFWFHPSFNTIFCRDIMEAIFKYIDEKRTVIKIMTCSQYSEFLNKGINDC